MSSRAPLAPEEDQGAPIEVERLHAAILEALALCGLKDLQDAFTLYLKGAAARLVKQGVIDLSIVYQPLSDDASISPPQAAKVMLLVSLYVESVLGAPLAVSDQVQAQIDEVLHSSEDLPQLLPSLAQGAERRLKEAKEQAAAAEKKKREEKEEKEREKEKEKEAQFRPLFPVEREKAERKAAAAGKKKGSPQVWLLGLVSILIILGMGAYWGRFYLQITREQEAYQLRQAALDLDVLSAIVPVTKVSEVAGVLMVTAKDDLFAAQSPEQQTRIAEKLLRAVNLPDVTMVQIFSGNTTSLFQAEMGGMKIVSIKRR